MRRSQIPHDVFFDSAPSSTSEEPKPDAEVAVEQPAAEPAGEMDEPARVEKLQISVYIEPQTAKTLDELRLALQYDYGKKASKSALVDLAIRHLAQDMERVVRAADAGELERG